VSTDNLGNVANSRGDYALAIERHSQSIEEWRALGDHWSVALVQANLALDYYRAGDIDQSLRLYAEALPRFEQLADPSQLARCLAGCGLCAHRYGQSELAVTLYAAAKACCLRAGVSTEYDDSSTHRPVLADLRERLPEPVFQGAWAAGTALTTEAAMAQVTEAGRSRVVSE
jgi:tetratricopeptide (TPR) repeat protein